MRVLGRAGDGIRTHDLPLTRRLLCQLSYSGDGRGVYQRGAGLPGGGRLHERHAPAATLVARAVNRHDARMNAEAQPQVSRPDRSRDGRHRPFPDGRAGRALGGHLRRGVRRRAAHRAGRSCPRARPTPSTARPRPPGRASAADDLQTYARSVAGDRGRAPRGDPRRPGDGDRGGGRGPGHRRARGGQRGHGRAQGVPARATCRTASATTRSCTVIIVNTMGDGRSSPPRRARRPRACARAPPRKWSSSRGSRRGAGTSQPSSPSTG